MRRPQLVLLKFTYYAQELLTDYYAIDMHFCMNNSLYVPDNFIKTVLLECINEGVKAYHYALSYNNCSIGVYQSFTTIFHKCIAIAFNIYFLLCWNNA